MTKDVFEDVEDLIDEDTLKSLSIDELKMLDKMLADVPPYYSIEEAEQLSQKAYDTYAKTFEPIVKEVTGTEQEGLSFYVIDAHSPYGFWVDTYISSYDNMLVAEWNKYIFDRHNPTDLTIEKLQDDDNIFESVYYAILEYCSQQGLYADAD